MSGLRAPSGGTPKPARFASPLDQGNPVLRSSPDADGGPGERRAPSCAGQRSALQVSMGQLFFDVVAKNDCIRCATWLLAHLGHFTLFFPCSAIRITSPNVLLHFLQVYS